MSKVVELYRYPVKSFTPERRSELSVVDGRVTGDRVLAFRFADKGSVDDWKWQTKHNFVALVNTPGMALLELGFDDVSRVLSLRFQGELFAEGSINTEEDRIDLCEAVVSRRSGGGRSAGGDLCRSVAVAEWRLLLEYCYRKAIGG